MEYNPQNQVYLWIIFHKTIFTRLKKDTYLKADILLCKMSANFFLHFFSVVASIFFCLT